MRIPPERRAARADARLVGAWLHRAEGVRPLDQPPALLSFTGADFMERFFEGLGRTGATWNPSAWTPRVAYRDWCELPRATRDLGGTARLYHTLQRRNPLQGELDSQDGGGQLEVALSDEREGYTWLRKLYLPLHRHFTLITTELLCDAPGTPRIDPKRVVEVGCVVRRLILDEKRERWEDWVAAPDGGGVWVELEGVDVAMQHDRGPVDPRALARSQGYGESSDPGIRAVLGITDVTSMLSLAVTPLAALPPGLGESGKHTAHFACLPLLTREQERPPLTPADEQAARKALAAEARRGLERAFSADKQAQMRARLLAAWERLATLVAASTQKDPGIPLPVIDCPWLRASLPVSLKGEFARAYTPHELMEVLRAGGGGLLGHAKEVLTCLAHVAENRKELLKRLRPDLKFDDPEDLGGLGDLVEAERSSPRQRGTSDAIHDSATRAVLHQAGLAVERVCADIMAALHSGGSGANAEVEAALSGVPSSFAGSVFADVLEVNIDGLRVYTPAELFSIHKIDEYKALLAWGVDMRSAVLTVLGCYSRHLGTVGLVGHFIDAAERWYDPDPPASPPQVSLRPHPPMPRFDADHIYAARCFARVRGLHPCDPEQIVWSQRTEPYLIADPLDLLGMPPTAMRLPDIPKLIADIPKMVKARALPMAAVHTPADSGFVTGEEAKDTRRGFGVAWICSFGIPVFTICAWVLFLIIFSILIMIPGFAWMLLLKFCVPVPAPKRA